MILFRPPTHLDPKSHGWNAKGRLSKRHADLCFGHLCDELLLLVPTGFRVLGVSCPKP